MFHSFIESKHFFIQKHNKSSIFYSIVCFVTTHRQYKYLQENVSLPVFFNKLKHITYLNPH